MLSRSTFIRGLFGCALAIAPCALCQTPTPTQTPKPDTAQAATTTLSLDARLVNLPVIVRDKKGAIVQNLTKEDFTLSVDNHTETIRYFDKDNDLPLTLGLLVDVSGSVRNALDDERTASSSFLDKMLTAPAGRPPDRAFIIQFSQQTELLQDVTASRPKLQAAIKELGSSDPRSNQQSDPDNGNGNGGGARRRGGTTLYDAVFLSADELLSKQKGRKAIILLTDGDDNGSRESLSSCIEAAQRADTIVYAIYFKGNQPGNNQPPQGNRGGGFPGGGGRFPGGGYPGGGGGYPGGGRQGGGQRPQETRADGKKILERMVNETGGRMFEESKKQDFASIYNQIAEELRSQYRLGFTPDQAIMDDGYHRVDLDLPKKKDLRIQTRDGYYTGK
jgi:VWFA-related protein